MDVLHLAQLPPLPSLHANDSAVVTGCMCAHAGVIAQTSTLVCLTSTHTLSFSFSSFSPTLSCYTAKQLHSHAHIYAMPLVTATSAAEDALKEHGIIPDVIDSFEAKTMLAVSYSKGNNIAEVTLGNTLTIEGTF